MNDQQLICVFFTLAVFELYYNRNEFTVISINELTGVHKKLRKPLVWGGTYNHG